MSADVIEDNNKAVIEAILFISEKPVLIDQIKKVLNHLTSEEIRGLLEELRTEYQTHNRGIHVYEVAGGFQFITAPFLSPFIKKFLAKEPRSERLSRSALESLAIIAYKQPVTKREIELLRKVNVDGIMKTLTDKNLVRVNGRKKAPGRPKLFCTTRQFLEYFGLKTLEELPKIENFPDFLLKKADEKGVPDTQTGSTEKV